MKKYRVFGVAVIVVLSCNASAFCFELPKHMLDERIVPMKVPCNAYESDIASQGTKALVVWSGHPAVWDVQDDIYGRFVDTAGMPVDTNFIKIGCGGVQQWHPKIAYGDGKYCIAWVQPHQDSTTNYYIYFTFVDTSGNVLDTLGRFVSGIYSDPDQIKIAYSDSCFLLVWEDERIASMLGDIYGARITLNGDVLDPNGFVICSCNDWQGDACVAGNGRNFVTAWYDHREINPYIYYTVIQSNGSMQAPVKVSTPLSYYPAIATDGTNYMISWADTHQNKVFYRRLDSLGNVVDSVPCTAVSAARRTLLSCTAQYYYLFYCIGDASLNYMVNFHRISLEGRMIDVSPVQYGYGEPSYYIKEAACGNNVQITYNDPDAYYYMVSVGAIDGEGDVINRGTHVSKDSTIVANSQMEPVATYGNGHYLVSWSGESNFVTADDVFSIRLDSLGQACDTSYAICNFTGWQIFNGIAAGENDFLAIWARDSGSAARNVFGRMLNASGVPVGAVFPICAASGTHQPCGVFYAGNYLVTWADGTSSIKCSIVDDGVVQNPTGKLIDILTHYTPGDGRIAWNGKKNLVVYDLNSVCGRFLNVAGDTMGSRFQLCDSVIRTLDDFSVAGCERNWLVVGSYTSGGSNVYGIRVDSTGRVLDKPAIQLSEHSGTGWSRVVYDGCNYAVVWYGGSMYYGHMTIEGVIMNPDGTILDRFHTMSNGYDQHYPGIASDGRGNILVTWHEEAPEPYNNLRVYGCVFKDQYYNGVCGYQADDAKMQCFIRCYPSPAYRQISISFQLTKRFKTEIALYNIAGQQVRTLLCGEQTKGRHTITWDGRDNTGRSVTPGVYLCRLKTDDISMIDKVVLIR